MRRAVPNRPGSGRKMCYNLPMKTKPRTEEDSEELRIARLELATALASLRGPDEVGRFFEDVFTKAETRAIALRWRIFQLLDEGLPQRAIGERLGVSLCKITRGSRFLKDPESVVRKILERDKKKRKAKRP